MLLGQMIAIWEKKNNNSGAILHYIYQNKFQQYQKLKCKK